uniref:Uncharacterized protein MANES_03G104900 n=1 Tax=Rhizophora mucronata TaxID=61149 RepID=A0A2P2KG98_RHIMU
MAARGDAAVSRIQAAAASLTSDNQSLIADIRKSLNMMKETAVDLERENESGKVKDLEKTVAELLESYEKCGHYSAAVESVANIYKPGEEVIKIFYHVQLCT